LTDDRVYTDYRQGFVGPDNAPDGFLIYACHTATADPLFPCAKDKVLYGRSGVHFVPRSPYRRIRRTMMNAVGRSPSAGLPSGAM